MTRLHHQKRLSYYIGLVGRENVARCLRLPSEGLVERFGELDDAQADRALRRLRNRTA